MNDDTHHVDDPAKLTTLSTYLQEHENANHYLQISLLQPLSRPEVLLANRNPHSRYMKTEDGSRGALTNHERLTFDALSQAWRSAWKKLPMSLIKSVTFDVTLPDIGGSRQADRSWFLLTIDENGTEITVDQMVPIRLVIILATVMRMQSRREEGVQFEFVSDDRNSKNIKMNKDICSRLSKTSVQR